MKTIFSKNNKKAVLILGLVFVISGCLFSLTPIKAIDTLLQYPQVPGAETTTVGNMSLPELIKYIYLFAVGICGAIALAAILLGAIKYIGAAGNPSKMGDAKEQIISALFGVVILLSSYLILNTINPDLVNLNINLSSGATINGVDGRVCYCTDSYDTDRWQTYPTPQECKEFCDDQCYKDFWDSGECRAN